MLGFNWVDLVIVALLLLAVVEGIRIGVASQLSAIMGFFASLFATGWLFPHLLPGHNVTIRTLVNGGLVLTVSFYVAVRCLDLGQKLHWSLHIGKLVPNRVARAVETTLGAVPALVAGLALVWLLGVALTRLPFVGLSNSVADARIVQQLTRTLPPVPAVFAQFDREVDPNAPPKVTTHSQPRATFSYNAASVQTAAAQAVPSLVRITSFGCGGVVSGSGFAVAPNVVMTNAHVIAGVKRPIVKYGGKSYEAIPVYFDATLDVALLRVNGLQLPALNFAPHNANLGTTAAVLGYPGGNYTVSPAIIYDTYAVSAASIYDQGSFGRGIYELQAGVDYGNSGGPVVLASGQVAGMIFSKTTDVPGYAFAITSPNLAPAVQQSKNSTRRVGTGACLVQ